MKLQNKKQIESLQEKKRKEQKDQEQEEQEQGEQEQRENSQKQQKTAPFERVKNFVEGLYTDKILPHFQKKETKQSIDRMINSKVSISIKCNNIYWIFSSNEKIYNECDVFEASQYILHTYRCITLLCFR